MNSSIVQPDAQLSSLISDKQEGVWYKIIITEIDFDTFVNSKKGLLQKKSEMCYYQKSVIDWY